MDSWTRVPSASTSRFKRRDTQFLRELQASHKLLSDRIYHRVLCVTKLWRLVINAHKLVEHLPSQRRAQTMFGKLKPTKTALNFAPANRDSAQAREQKRHVRPFSF